jgi:hypothetical protein
MLANLVEDQESILSESSFDEFQGHSDETHALFKDCNSFCESFGSLRSLSNSDSRSKGKQWNNHGDVLGPSQRSHFS